jgi:CPA2 family monovalent cation:H+ antiporter-2
LAAVQQSLPGLGEPIPVRVPPKSDAIGKTLAELNLRGLTGATVLAINRATGSVTIPSATETIQTDDILALAGTKTAVETAAKLLIQGPRSLVPEPPRDLDSRRERAASPSDPDSTRERAASPSDPDV